MKIEGHLLIGQQQLKGNGEAIYAVNPLTNEKLEPPYPGGFEKEVNQACELAAEAFDTYRNLPLTKRAEFLEQIAQNILDLGEALVERAVKETGLPQARIEGERGRTVGQLRLFADVVRQGNFIDARLDSAMPDRTPLPRADLRMQRIGLGPVAVFGASNFPLAFSVAGGDTASALAAGCPVVVKAHSAHPGTSELVGKAIQKAVKSCEMPEGVFSLLYGSGKEIGSRLVAHPAIKAVGFTGSRSGGLALCKIAAERAEPIPVYAEMSSINPVFLFSAALENRGDKIAQGFAGSLTMGAGQFCTNPGLVIAAKGDALETFIQQTSQALSESASQTMLTPGIYNAYQQGVDKLSQQSGVENVASGSDGKGENQCKAALFKTSAKTYLENEALADEIFGASSLIIECEDSADFSNIAEHLEGQLTATLQLDPEDYDDAKKLLPVLERKAGRILCNGFPTGVEVSHTMVHGGPFPATSDSRTTSVGSAAIERFLRPVCYQDLPKELLPAALDDDNSLNIRRLVNGKNR